MSNELDMARSVISDMHKDAYGFRPRGEDFWSRLTTLEACDAEMDRLQVAVDFAREEDIRREDAAIVDFEAAIARTIEVGAGDRDTAIRWLMSAQVDADDQDPQGYFEYLNGLPYGYVTGDDKYGSGWKSRGVA